MNSIYRDIAERTGGDIYIGVVGPVRTGKSTFVSQFIQKVILPNITDKNDKKRTVDELPQSADGKNNNDNSAEVCSFRWGKNYAW